MALVNGKEGVKRLSSLNEANVKSHKKNRVTLSRPASLNLLNCSYDNILGLWTLDVRPDFRRA